MSELPGTRRSAGLAPKTPGFVTGVAAWRRGIRRTQWSVIAVVTLAATAACDTMGSSWRERERAPYLATDSMGVLASHVATVRVHSRTELRETSAAVVSSSQPGIIFTINDSGNEPLLFALDTAGADRGAWRITNASNVDWESAASGPCAELDTVGPPLSGSRRCLYIGETGDNESKRSRRAIYRVPEPNAQGGGFTGSLVAERLTYRYSDGPRDVEAMYVGPDGTMYFIAKRALVDASGRLRWARVYALAREAWRSDQPGVATFLDSIAVVPGSAPMRMITDAALAPDARYVAVRTYAQVYVFAADTVTGRIRSPSRPSICNIIALDERQGEGIGWLGLTRQLVLTSEGRQAPMHVVRCPVP